MAPKMEPKTEPERTRGRPKSGPERAPSSDRVLAPKMLHFGPFLGPNLELFWTFFGAAADVPAEASTFRKHYKNQ